MKILVLSFYYQPDLCAGSFRTTALVEQLKHLKDVEIEVITTMPNRYASFSAGALNRELNENIKIHRIDLPSHKSGMLDQVKSFTVFYLEAMKIVNSEQYDVIYATSSRLFTAFLGARIAKKRMKPLYLDIRDIFVDTIKDVLSPKLVFLIKPFLSIIEKYTFTSANHINLVSKGFKSYFQSRYPNVSYSWYTNGIDEEFLNLSNGTSHSKFKDDKKTILYAGNIGEGQGLHTILPKLSKLAEPHYIFNVIGDGGRKPQLIEKVDSCHNVELFPPVNRTELIKQYLNADVLFLHLNDYDAFEKVLPSKVFEYAATGKPILAGVSGYAAEFISSEVPNAEVFHPGDAKAALNALQKLTFAYTDRHDFISKYTRQNIMKKMSRSIVEIGS